jgi:hypothetical protein
MLSDHVLGVFGKFSTSRVAQAWGSMTFGLSSAKVLEY